MTIRYRIDTSSLLTWSLSCPKGKKIQHAVFPCGHPPQYWLRSSKLSLQDRTGLRVFFEIWSYLISTINHSFYFRSRIHPKTLQSFFIIVVVLFSITSKHLSVNNPAQSLSLYSINFFVYRKMTCSINPTCVVTLTHK